MGSQYNLYQPKDNAEREHIEFKCHWFRCRLNYAYRHYSVRAARKLDAQRDRDSREGCRHQLFLSTIEIPLLHKTNWGYLAYTVGFGGSLIWFGSSAGVNQYPEAKSVGLSLRHGWYIAIAYVVGFFAMLIFIGWQPDPDLWK